MPPYPLPEHVLPEPHTRVQFPAATNWPAAFPLSEAKAQCSRNLISKNLNTQAPRNSPSDVLGSISLAASQTVPHLRRDAHTAKLLPTRPILRQQFLLFGFSRSFSLRASL